MKRMKLVSTVLVLTMALSAMVTGCKASGANGGGNGNGETLKLGVVNKGYGEEFAYKLAEAFEAKTGIDTEVAKSNSSQWMDTALLAGAKNNDIDVFFDINALAMKNLATEYFLDDCE